MTEEEDEEAVVEEADLVKEDKIGDLRQRAGRGG